MGLLSSIFGGGISTKADCDREIARLQGDVEHLKADLVKAKAHAKELKAYYKNNKHANFSGSFEQGVIDVSNRIAEKKARIAKLKAMKSSLPKG